MKARTAGAERCTKRVRGKRWKSGARTPGRLSGECRSRGAEDVGAAVKAAEGAAAVWGATPIKERVRPLQRFYDLVSQHSQEIAALASLESGKTPAEALAGLQRGLEVVEFAIGLPNLDRGGSLEVSRGVTCEYRREPLGVVAGITPFNFPAMVPMWMYPIALALGNAFILKPSEKVPLTSCRMAELIEKAGFLPGLFSVIHGDRTTVEAIVDHPAIKADRLRRFDTRCPRGPRSRDPRGETRALPGRRQEPPDRDARCGSGDDREGRRGLVHRLRRTALYGGKRARHGGRSRKARPRDRSRGREARARQEHGRADRSRRARSSDERDRKCTRRRRGGATRRPRGALPRGR